MEIANRVALPITHDHADEDELYVNLEGSGFIAGTDLGRPGVVVGVLSG